MTSTATLPPVATSIVIDFGSHTMFVDHADRTVEIWSDAAAGDRRCQRDWRAVCAELRSLGVTDLDEAGYFPSDDTRSRTDCFAGTF
jgi:hypothetical protein